MKFSLKTKLLALITLLVTSPMGYLLYHTIVIQKQEILNSSYEKQSMELKLLSEKFSNSIKGAFNTLKLANSASDVNSIDQYKTYLDSLIASQNKDVSNLFILEIPTTKGAEIKKLYENKKDDSSYLNNNSIIVNNLETILSKGSLVQKFSDREILVAIADLNYSPEMERILVLSTIVKVNKDFGYSDSWVAVFSDDNNLFSTTPDVGDLYKRVETQTMGVSTFEYQEGLKTYLVSSLVNSSFKFVIKQDKETILMPVYESTQKIVLIFLIALSVGTAMSVVFTKKLVGPMEELCSTTELIGRGNFNIKVTSKSNDEVGVLAQSIENMTVKIRHLMKDNAEKARLENEFNMTAKIQKDTIPKDKLEDVNFTLLSQNLQASECGGDWWGSFSVGNKLVLMIGDATGHGLSSSMMTVTAKAIKSTASQKGITDPNEILTLLNQAVLEGASGSILMTFFVATIDFDSNTITYANAGHNTPWIFKEDGKVEALTFKGIRLGENSVFTSSTPKVSSFTPGDILFLYTDGLIETTGKNGKEFGKNQVRKMIQEEKVKGIDNAYSKLKREFKEFMGTKKFPDDDATFVFLEYKKLEKKEAS